MLLIPNVDDGKDRGESIHSLSTHDSQGDCDRRHVAKRIATLYVDMIFIKGYIMLTPIQAISLYKMMEPLDCSILEW